MHKIALLTPHQGARVACGVVDVALQTRLAVVIGGYLDVRDVGRRMPNDDLALSRHRKQEDFPEQEHPPLVRVTLSSSIILWTGCIRGSMTSMIRASFGCQCVGQKTPVRSS